MWDDENDKKLRDAAENFHPPLDENAWQKMEKMLDEHLPQEKRRKRILLFIPFILILGGLIFFIFFYNGNSDFSKPNVPATTAAKGNTSKDMHVDEKKIPSLNPGGNRNEKATTASVDAIEKNKMNVGLENEKAAADFVSRENENKSSGKKIFSKAENKVLNSNKDLAESKTTNSSNSVSANEDRGEISNSKVQEKQQEEKNILPVSKESKPDTKSVKQKDKKQNKFANNFSVGLSFGPGVSAVGSREGKMTLDLGIIAGYHFAKHFGLRTGVFISKKIYSATPDQYSLPPGTSYYYLQKVNANCNVIDIPLNVDYYFDQKGKHSWFVSAGLSSYLMKKETYDYFYKMPTGQIYNEDWSISNQNKHFFSVLDLSAGYQYLLNKQFSLTAQPYVDLPLTGIGAGKVKLNSAGILFTIKVKPFLKKNK